MFGQRLSNLLISQSVISFNPWRNPNESIYIFTDKEGKDKDKDKNAALAVPRLSVCADAQKVDRAKLAQTEVNTSKK